MASCWQVAGLASSSIKLSTTDRLRDITHMCYEYVARTLPVRTAFTHTCCQGQTSGLTVRPDAARCWFIETPITSDHQNPLCRFKIDVIIFVCYG